MTLLKRPLKREQRTAFAHQFRAARAMAFRDAEAFEEHLYVVERLGSYMLGSQGDLGKYQSAVDALASESPFAFDAEKHWPEFHVSFTTLYEEARVGRNDAMHQGAVARTLARQAQELALILEDALMSGAKKARDFMVRGPTCAELWEPLSAIRRTMLLNAYSFLPFRSARDEWRLISDSDLVQFIRTATLERKKRLLMTLDEALKEGLKSTQAVTCAIADSIEDLSSRTTHVPWLVVDRAGRLLGLIAAFDLL